MRQLPQGGEITRRLDEGGLGDPGSCLPGQITNFAYCLSSAFSLLAGFFGPPFGPLVILVAGETTAWCVATLQDE